MENPNHMAPTSASRWSVVTFLAPNDASKARARNSCGVVTLFTPNTAGVSQAIGVVARSAARSPATRTAFAGRQDRKSTRLNSSHSQISYAVFCLKKKKKKERRHSAEY